MVARSFARSVSSLAELHSFIHAFCTERGIDADRSFDLDLVLEELFTNQVKYHASDREIEVALAGDARQVTITVTDHDVDRFDPTAVPDTVDRRNDELLEGGRGLRLVRALTDELRYDYRERTSRITAITVNGPVIVDCNKLEYISSAGLSVLVETYKRLSAAGHSLRLTGMQPRVRTVFSLSGLDRILKID
jgi:anti-anti-sigma factor